jgi:hypothetical protein
VSEVCTPISLTLGTGNDDGTVHLWNEAFKSPFTGSQNVGSVAFDPVSRNLAVIVPDLSPVRSSTPQMPGPARHDGS